jgi:sortase (surface protein transpeptidase)
VTAAGPVAGQHLRQGGAAGRHRARRRLRLTAVRVGLAVVAAGGGLLASVLPDAASTASATPAAEGPAAGAPVPPALTVGSTGERTPVPTRVRVPAIAVDSDLVRLGVDADRVLVPPTDFATAGWFAEGPAPGATGPAVLAGHVDSTAGPAVFFRLRELAPGDEVLVDRADGSTVRFEVTSVDRYPKDAFPTDQVYGPTPRAELRLITCGGEFDAGERSYRDNVVVTAVLA